MSSLVVREPGLFTTLQDLGRFGAQALGMPVAGAIDMLALRLANALAGNGPNMGALEVGFMGPTLEIAADSLRIAVVGSIQLALLQDGAEKPLATNQSHRLTRGQVLKLGFVSGAAYAYLAVEGGFAVTPFINSVSTYTRAGLGGFNGRKLTAGDTLPLARDAVAARSELATNSALPYGASLDGNSPIRIVLGPQDDYFTPDAIAAFLGNDYTVTKEADRMGLRLDGPKLNHSKGADIVSDAIATGCIQVPGTGAPIVLLADHQTIGGYPKIATIASVDLPRTGQLTPGSKLRFAAVTVAQAEQLRRDQEQAFARLIASIAPTRPAGGIDLDALSNANLIDGMIDAQSANDH
ncbi:MAG: biotin-dependent carboxyltransferase family protein [Rhodospirillales bacterium]